MNKEDILEEALRITSGDRQAQYGPPDQDFARTAAMWSALFGDKLSSPFEARDVAMAMICLKLSRETHQRKRDNSVDGAGYFRCLYLCNEAAAAKEEKDSLAGLFTEWCMGDAPYVNVTEDQLEKIARKTAPSGHRWVLVGEVLRKGDKYLSDITGKWTEISYPIGEPASSNGVYIRKIWTAVGPNTNYVTVEKEISRIEGPRRWLEVNMPDGLPPLPAPPDGYDVWAYRGLGWKCADESTPKMFMDGGKWVPLSVSSGIRDFHYVEAIKQ